MSENTRPCLMLLPGLLCDETVFAAARARLDAVAEVVVPDFRGFDSIVAMAQAVLDRAPQRFSVAGFSMGGRVAFEVARMAPERVARFCVFDTGLGPARPGEAEQRQALVDLAHDKGMAALAAAWLPPMLHPDNRGRPALIGPLTEMVCRFTPAQYAGQIRALLERPDARPVPRAIRCPALVLCGAQDEWSPPAQNEAIATAIDGAEFKVIAEAGHFLPVEQPDAFAAALADWIARTA